MTYSLPVLALSLVLAGCAQTTSTDGLQQSTGATRIAYPMAALPMTDTARMETILDLSQLASADARRACTAEDLEFTELSLILATVDYEEWRTAPWTANQEREVAALRQRWQELGGSSRAVSDTCRRFGSRLG